MTTFVLVHGASGSAAELAPVIPELEALDHALRLAVEGARPRGALATAGATYTAHGAAMIAGGLLFAWSALRAAALPKVAVVLFVAGLLANLGLAMVRAPDTLQTVGTAIRNAGLVGMGYALLFRHRRREV